MNFTSNNDILQLNHNNIPKFHLRNNLKMSLKKYYMTIDENQEKNIYIGKIDVLQYNLTEILNNHDCNILTNIKFISQDTFTSSPHYIITFSIMHNDIKLVCMSNKSHEIHDLNLLDYFETRFIDIRNLTNDIFLLIEFATFNDYSNLPLNIGIYCTALNINSRYSIKKKVNENSLIEYIRFYSLINNVIEDKDSDHYETYKNKLLSHNTCHYIFIDECTTQLNIYNKNAVCSVIYFSFLWNNQYTIDYPKIKSIIVIIDGCIIEYNSSRINVNNLTNLSFIEFYPDNNNDLLKSNDIVGINLQTVKEFKIQFTFKDNYAIKTKICMGLMLYNSLSYK